MRHTSLRARWPVMLLAALVLGACGDDGGNSGRQPAGASSSRSTTTTQAAGVTTTVAATTTTVARAGPTTVVVTTPPGTNLGKPTLGNGSTVTTAGMDRVLFGMTLVNAERAAGSRLLPDPSYAFGADCAVVKPESGPEGIVFTISKGTVERVDIVAPAKNHTRSGAGLGTTVAQLQSLYGQRLATPQGAQATTLVYTPVDAGDASFRVIFETDGNVVTSFRAGRVPQVNNVIPC